jgi:murein DD-endopeptidase MepM/ murein hydrolase activator NlpD
MKKNAIFILFLINAHISFSQDNVDHLYDDAKRILINTIFTMENKYYVFNTFGFMKDPFTGNDIFLDFVFINAKYNCIVSSVTDGEVLEIGFDNIMGNYIKIQYNDFEFEYGNLINVEVNIGDKILAKQIIGHGGRLFEPFGNGIKIRIKYKNILLDPNILLNYDENLLSIF